MAGIPPHDVAGVADPQDRCVRRPRDINGAKATFSQHKAMGTPLLRDVYSHDLASVVDPTNYGDDGPRDVNSAEAAPRQEKARWSLCSIVYAHHVARVIDPVDRCIRRPR